MIEALIALALSLGYEKCKNCPYFDLEMIERRNVIV